MCRAFQTARQACHWASRGEGTYNELCLILPCTKEEIYAKVTSRCIDIFDYPKILVSGLGCSVPVDLDNRVSVVWYSCRDVFSPVLKNTRKCIPTCTLLSCTKTNVTTHILQSDILLFDKLCNISFLSFYLGKGLEKPSEGLKVQAFLLFEEKQSFRKLGDIIYQQNKSGEIYVRRDALTVIYGEHLLYGNLVTYGRSGLRQLWNLVFARDSPLQGKGLLALGLLNAVIVWPRKKPNHLGCVTGKGQRTNDFNLVR